MQAFTFDKYWFGDEGFVIINIIYRVAKRENITLIKTVNKFLKSFEHHFLNWGQEFAVKVLWFSHTTHCDQSQSYENSGR